MDLNQMQPMGTPSTPMESPSQPTSSLPEMPRPSGMGNPRDGQKKQLLQKLVSNLLNKPGRSMHELINGIKAAIGAYKNYAKEWDTLNGISPAGNLSPTPTSGGDGGSIQRILQDIQKNKPKDGGGGPGVMPPAMSPAMPPAMPPEMPPEMPPTMSPEMSSPSSMQQTLSPEILQQISMKLQEAGVDINDQQAVASFIEQLKQTNPEVAVIFEQAIAQILGSSGEGDSLIAGQPQQSDFDKPAPVSNLGIHGF